MNKVCLINEVVAHPHFHSYTLHWQAINHTFISMLFYSTVIEDASHPSCKKTI